MALLPGMSLMTMLPSVVQNTSELLMTLMSLSEARPLSLVSFSTIVDLPVQGFFLVLGFPLGLLKIRVYPRHFEGKVVVLVLHGLEVFHPATL